MFSSISSDQQLLWMWNPSSCCVLLHCAPVSVSVKVKSCGCSCIWNWVFMHIKKPMYVWVGPFLFCAIRFIFDDGEQRSENRLSFSEQLKSSIMDKLIAVSEIGLFCRSARKYRICIYSKCTLEVTLTVKYLHLSLYFLDFLVQGKLHKCTTTIFYLN